MLKCTLQKAFDFCISMHIRSHFFSLKDSLLLMLFILSSHNTNIRFLFLQFNLTLDNTTQPHQCNLPFQSAFFHELAYVGYILLSNFTILMYSNILSSLLFLSFHKISVSLFMHIMHVLIIWWGWNLEHIITHQKSGNKMHDFVIEMLKIQITIIIKCHITVHQMQP